MMASTATKCVGESFTSYKHLQEKIEMFENTNFVQIGHRDSRMLEAARKSA